MHTTCLSRSLECVSGAALPRYSGDAYKAKSIRHGLPKGKQGIPEIAFIVAEHSHEGGPCTEALRDIVQKIDGISSSGHPQGVTAFATVNGEVVGEDHKPFPRR
jgi:hypothetical protein